MDNISEPDKEQLEMVAKTYAARSRYWPSYTWKIQTSYLQTLNNNKDGFTDRGIDVEALRKHNSDLFDKINASFYHLETLREHESFIINLSKQGVDGSRKNTPANTIGIIASPYEPVSYEYEAILVTLKSALDVMVMTVAPYCELTSDDLAKFINEAPQRKNPNDLLQKMLSIVQESNNDKVIKEFLNGVGKKSKRNHAVHQGSLPTGTINLQYTASDPEVGILKTRTMGLDIVTTNPFEEQDLETYCANLFYGVSEIAMQALEALLDQALPRGEKMSVYDERMEARRQKTTTDSNEGTDK
ncbi:MAG TPA: hypothetical protein VFZ58_04555 [Candidatus Saccharimonadales bacterium]